MEDLRTRARQWAADDIDPDARAELEALLAAEAAGDPAARAELDDRFAGSLGFGTAGLRGVVAAGPNRMNRAVVARTTYALAQALLAHVEGAGGRGVVVGYDGRSTSRPFAEDVAVVLAAAGIGVHLFAEPVPTPLVGFAVIHLQAAAGVVLTASHNPAPDNGYKVFAANGAQLIPPFEASLVGAMTEAPRARDVPRAELTRARAAGRVVEVAPRVLEAYRSALRRSEVHAGGARGFPLVYTPLHGVGFATARQVFADAGFTQVVTVPEQEAPDPRFSTLTSPNPEERGVLSLALSLAASLGAPLVLANDPDADRLAVAVPSPRAGADYVQLTGNQVGALLGHYLLTQEPLHEGAAPRAVVSSIVSSPLLGAIAEQLGVRYEETLTGFKWIANRALALEAEGARFVFGYEEALGYMVGTVVRDKDGIGAAVMMAELFTWLATQGRTLLQELEAIHRRYGLFISAQVSLVRTGVEGAASIRAMMDHLRRADVTRIGPLEVLAVRDYEAQTRTPLLRVGPKEVRRGEPTRIALAASNVLAFELQGGSRVVARPSGTEPKMKLYIDVREPVDLGEPMEQAEHRANAALAELAQAFLAEVVEGEKASTPPASERLLPG